MNARFRTVLVFLLLLPGLARAHAVTHTVTTGEAVVVRLAYANGQPFSFEGYELTPEGRDLPAQVGRTDEGGRVVFLPGGVARWRLKAASADGHGVDLTFTAPTLAASAPVSESGPGRGTLALLGLALILGGFGAYQLFLHTRRRT